MYSSLCGTPGRRGYPDELVLVGLQRDYAEHTHNSYKVALAFLKAIAHELQAHGIEKRHGYNLFKKDQIISLLMGTIWSVRTGTSVRAAPLCESLQAVWVVVVGHGIHKWRPCVHTIL
jgi:hypothetical protein